MPRLLQNIQEIIQAFGRYASAEGGCTALTRGELRRLLEQEFSSVIVKPHDPATVDEVLRLLDEDNTGTVEFKEFLVLVFKVAQACFKTLGGTPGGACRDQESEGHRAGSAEEPGQGQRRSGTEEAERDGKGVRQREQSSCPQGGQASRGPGRTGTHVQGQGSSSVQAGGHGRQAYSQRQRTVSQQTQVTGQAAQTPRVEGKGHHQSRDRSSERQSQTSQRTGKTVTRTTTQIHTGASQRVEQNRSPQAGNASVQTQWSTHGQDGGTESHGQDWSQTHQVVTGGRYSQAQAGSYTQTVDWSQAESQVGAQEQGQTQMQPRGGQGRTQGSPQEAGEPRPGGQTQTGAGTVTERQESDNTPPGVTGGQGERVPTVVSEEWVDDHTREVVIRTEDPGRLHPGAPSA